MFVLLSERMARFNWSIDGSGGFSRADRMQGIFRCISGVTAMRSGEIKRWMGIIRVYIKSENMKYKNLLSVLFQRAILSCMPQRVQIKFKHCHQRSRSDLMDQCVYLLLHHRDHPHHHVTSMITQHRNMPPASAASHFQFPAVCLSPLGPTGPSYHLGQLTPLSCSVIDLSMKLKTQNL